MPLGLFGPDRALIPGDLGDARFNNYILEHFHRFITGRTAAYWDAPFMYPWKNVIALSDNLLGTAPVYSAFRSMGLSREGAYQAWILAMFALNYWCCTIALRKWGGNWVLAACAGFIFAFGIHNIGQINNLQTLPKFVAPLTLLFFWRHLYRLLVPAAHGAGRGISSLRCTRLVGLCTVLVGGRGDLPFTFCLTFPRMALYGDLAGSCCARPLVAAADDAAILPGGPRDGHAFLRGRGGFHPAPQFLLLHPPRSTFLAVLE